LTVEASVPRWKGSGHSGMAHPWVADGGNGLHIWKITVNILNSQLQTADNMWSCSMGGGQGV